MGGHLHIAKRARAAYQRHHHHLLQTFGVFAALTSASEPAKEARAGEPALATQPIVSVPKMPDNLEQTIVDPNNPAVIREHVNVPNMVVMTPIPAAPVAANPGIPKLVLPPDIKVVAPAAEPVNNSLAQMKLPNLPDQQVVQPAPDAANLKMKLSDMSIAQLEPTVSEPADHTNSGARAPQARERPR